jgi:uracil-DNA glycosylase family 4
VSGISPRDAAFLAEMGIGPLWTARSAAPVEDLAPEPAAYQPPMPSFQPGHAPKAAPPPAQPPAPEFAPGHEPRAPMVPAGDSAWGEEPAVAVTEAEIARMSWAQLRAGVASCTRCGLCAGGRKPVMGSGAQAARWLVAAGASNANDEKERQPLTGDAGRLLDNMLAAVDLSREENAYVTNAIKCRPVTASGADRAPTAEEAQACRPWIERELALCGASMLLSVGQIAANSLLGKPLQESLAGSRGQLHELRGVALVATLHPGELLRRGADKALAWADLCLARAHDGRPG